MDPVVPVGALVCVVTDERNNNNTTNATGTRTGSTEYGIITLYVTTDILPNYRYYVPLIMY